MSRKKVEPKISYIYLIYNGSAYKIGKADNPQKRLRELQTGSHLELRLILFFAVYEKQVHSVERKIHKRFASKRLEGEWFNLNPQDVNVVKERRF